MIMFGKQNVLSKNESQASPINSWFMATPTFKIELNTNYHDHGHRSQDHKDCTTDFIVSSFKLPSTLRLLVW